jgi:hypothetical protein
VSIDVSEEHIASIFRVEKISSARIQRESMWQAACHLLSRWFLADTQRTTRRYIPEDGTLYNHRCENLKSYKSIRVYILIRSITNATFVEFQWLCGYCRDNISFHSRVSLFTTCVGLTTPSSGTPYIAICFAMLIYYWGKYYLKLIEIKS